MQVDFRDASDVVEMDPVQESGIRRGPMVLNLAMDTGYDIGVTERDSFRLASRSGRKHHADHVAHQRFARAAVRQSIFTDAGVTGGGFEYGSPRQCRERRLEGLNGSRRLGVIGNHDRIAEQALEVDQKRGPPRRIWMEWRNGANRYAS